MYLLRDTERDTFVLNNVDVAKTRSVETFSWD